MIFHDKFFFKVVKIRYEETQKYQFIKVLIVGFISFLFSLSISLRTIDKLRSEDIRVSKVTYKPFKSGWVSNSAANITVFFETTSIVNKLKVILLLNDASGKELQFTQIVDIVPDPLIFKNKASFDLPESVKEVNSPKFKLVVNSYERELVTSVETTD